MQITDTQVRYFIVLVLIERWLKYTTEQYLLDEYIKVVSTTKEEVYEIHFLKFRTSSQIPDDINYVKFQDDIILYAIDDFLSIWTHMTTGDDSLTEKIANASDN